MFTEGVPGAKVLDKMRVLWTRERKGKESLMISYPTCTRRVW